MEEVEMKRIEVEAMDESEEHEMEKREDERK